MSAALPGGRPPVVLQVLPALSVGGAELDCLDIATALSASGYTSLVTSAGGPMSVDLERRYGARHIQLPLLSRSPWAIYRNIDRLCEVIRQEKVDILHVRSRAVAWSGYFAARRMGVPLVTTFHAAYNFSATPGLKQLKKGYNSVMASGDRVIAISDFIRRHIMAEYKIGWSQLRVIPRGIDVSVFDPDRVSAARMVALAENWRLPDDLPIILLPGRLTRLKGHMLLLQALALLKRPVLCLLVGSDAGRAAYRQETEALARRLGVDNRLHIVGNCRDMAAAYKLADVVVSASTDPEGFGRVTAEALAMGRPVVAPNHGAAPEQIISGQTGWLFAPGNAADLADKLELALSLDADSRARLRDRAMAVVREKFTVQQMTGSTLALYRELLAEAAEKRNAGVR